MKSYSLQLNKDQFLSIISSLNDNDKMEIYNEIKKSIFLQRFNQLLKSLRTDDLTIDEITKEVESVREERYEKGNQIL
ncbi:MAG: hypothetical protein WD607_09875 [Candidatus Paceibacterota bacterium]